MNASEIKEKTFDKSAFGYKVDEVAQYLEQISAYVSKLENENKDSQKKMQVLAKKIEEYRTEEDSMKSIILSAQKVSSTVINEAKAKAEAILNDANIEKENLISNSKNKSETMVSQATIKAATILKEAQDNSERMMAQTRDEADFEQRRLENMQKEVSQFKTNLLAMYKAHLELITKLPELKNQESSKEQKPEQPLDETNLDVKDVPDEQDQKSEPQVTPQTDDKQDTKKELKSKQQVDQAVKQYEKDELAKTAVFKDEKNTKEKQAASNFKVVITENDSDKPEDDDNLKSKISKFESKFGELKFGKNAQK